MAASGYIAKTEVSSELQVQSEHLKRSIDLLRDVVTNVRVRLEPLLMPPEPVGKSTSQAIEAPPQSAHGQFIGTCRADLDCIVADVAELLRRLAV